MKRLVYLMVAIVILGLVVSGCLPVVPPSEQGESVTLPNKSPGVLEVPTIAYPTIQAAINAAAPGDTINVASGTYPENVTIPPGKNGLQLIGAGSGVTSIAPTGGRPVTLLGWVGLIDGFRIQGFTLVTADASHAFLAGSGTPDGSTYNKNLEFEDIVVNGGQRGIGLNAVQGVTFDNVHLSNISGSPEAALELTGVFDLTFTDGSITWNNIGVRVQPTGPGEIGEGYGLNGDMFIQYSSLTDNTSFAILNLEMTSNNIEALCNWWGDVSGPSYGGGIGSGDRISDVVVNIHFIPWLLSPNGSCSSFEEIIEITNKCADDTNNHGQYISCVDYWTNELLESGDITAEEKGAIMSWVTKSNIGKKINHTTGNIYVVHEHGDNHITFYAYEKKYGTTNGYLHLCPDGTDVPYLIANVLCCNVVDENTAWFAWGSEEFAQWNVAKVIDNGSPGTLDEVHFGYFDSEDDACAAVAKAEGPLPLKGTIVNGNLVVYYYGD